MAITFPLDFLSTFPGWSTEFTPGWRQEQSRTAGGRTYAKDLGDPLWKATFQSRSLRPNELDHWRARIALLENGLQTFVAGPSSRCFPIAYPKGSWPTGEAFNGIGQVATLTSKAVSLKGMPAGYTVKIGDYIQIGAADLHQVVEDALAGEDGVTGAFEVRPYLWPTAALNMAVKVARPSCIMALQPDTVSSSANLSDGRGSITFQAIEAR